MSDHKTITWPDHPAYNRTMGLILRRRGFPNLADTCVIAANDCPKGCKCEGCEATRAEAREARAEKEKRWARRAVA